ncbi:uracil-DNA glycosylase [Lutispora saccharofermentans]|uniref:Type-4 uracil-DNA glycosylase n=1 Tax=Lutispora saccharofermentans TaxID=3024236 RepID=A0ABT1NKP3_9FIRM|nr:uracil-DNA glycosylase [Lutispora saccharofermentans]MCQ1531835.1 uracil-DNA glycosylase [Lutispora saccharofermentans]
MKASLAQKDITEDLKQNNLDLKEYVDNYFERDIPLVFGDGPAGAKIVLAGEAPGRNEVEKGKPFVGQAGKNLEEFMDILELKREDIYITNVVKFRPYRINEKTGRTSNRPPTREEIKICRPFLRKELELLRPKLIVSLGNVPLKCLTMDESATIGEYHGKPIGINFTENPTVLFPLYHPASIIYRAELKSTYIEDLYKLKEFIAKNNEKIHKQ